MSRLANTAKQENPSHDNQLSVLTSTLPLTFLPTTIKWTLSDCKDATLMVDLTSTLKGLFYSFPILHIN